MLKVALGVLNKNKHCVKKFQVHSMNISGIIK